MIRKGLLIMMLVVLVASTARGATVHLRRTAVVSEPSVRLGHVGEVTGCPAGLKQLLQEVIVADSPAGQMKRRLKVSEIRRRLFEAGINQTEIVLAGASEIEITRKRTRRAAGRTGSLGKRVRRAVLREAGRALERPADELELTSLRFEAFGIPENAHVTVTPVGEVDFPGTVTFDAVATVHEAEAGRFTVSAELEGVRRVVVAKRNLGAGNMIRARDVEVRRMDGAAAPARAIEKTQLVVGERLARRVPAGGAITTDVIAKPILVNRGDVCRMTIRGRGFRIVGEARARDKGSLGEMIRMESIQDRKRFAAVVSGPREVEIRLAKEEN